MVQVATKKVILIGCTRLCCGKLKLQGPKRLVNNSKQIDEEYRDVGEVSWLFFSSL